MTISRQIDKGVKITQMSLRLVVELTLLVVFTVLMAWLLSYLLDPRTLPIQQVRLEGEFRHLSTEALQKRVEGHVQGGFFNINVTAVRDRLLSEPWVKEVSVHRVWPDTLQVFVTEHVAIARWGENGLLNTQGELFSPERTSFPDNLPLIAGPEGRHQSMMQKYNYVRQLMQPASMNIRSLTLDERRAWSIETDAGLRIVLGREDFDARIHRFTDLFINRFFDSLEKIEIVDMRYPNGFAVKWKNETKTNDGASGAE